MSETQPDDAPNRRQGGPGGQGRRQGGQGQRGQGQGGQGGQGQGGQGGQGRRAAQGGGGRGANVPARRSGPGGGLAGPRNKHGALAARRRNAKAGAGARPTIVIDLPASDGARKARRRRFFRSLLIWLSFLVMVAAPTGVATWYLWSRAADQYASEVSFAVRSLDSSIPSPVMDMFGGAADSTSGDSQMLFEYLQSQPLVEIIDRKVDLEKIYNHPDADPVFSLGHDRTIEEKLFYWNLATTVSYDSVGGIIYVQVRAFDPADAQRVAQAVLDESERLINDLSTKARNDAVGFALIDLEEAETRVRDARRKLQSFRMTERSVDVTQNIAQAMNLISELRGQRAAIQADYDSRLDMLGEESPSLAALRRQMASLDAQIAAERKRIASVDPNGAADGGDSLTKAAGAQEELLVELGFAENMYTSALAAVETARADARRAQRYLATHIAPTRSEEAEYPDRVMWTVAIAFLTLLIWAITLLIISSVRDRR